MIQSLVSSLILWLLLFVLLMIINIVLFNVKEISSLFRRISKKIWFLLLLILIIAITLRFFVVNHMHNLHYDEDAYLDIAKHISINWNNCLCLYNVNGECEFCGFSFKSIGFSFILGIFFKIFGATSTVAFYVSSLFGSLTVIMIFLLSYLLSKKEVIALFSSLILALYPLHIRWSGSASAEIVSLFFIILTFFLLFVYFEFQNLKYLVLSALVLIFSMTIREENLLLLPFFLLFFIVKRFSRKKQYLTIGLILLLIIPFIIGNLILQKGETIEDSYASSRYTFWKQGKILSFSFLIKNIFRNMVFFINTDYSMLIVILFFLIGIFFMIKRNNKIGIALLLWLFSILAIFSAFLEEPLVFSEVRHYIPILLSVVIFANYGIYHISRIKIIKKIRGLQIIAIALVLSALIYMPYITSDKAPVTEAQQDYEFLKYVLKDIPKECIILTPESYVLDFFDRSSLSIYLLDKFDISETCKYYYASEICYREASELCTDMHSKYDLELLYTNNRHSLFRIK